MAAIIRRTRQRAAIRAVLEVSGRPMSPDEVLGAAQHLVRGLGIATVYRNIKSLIEEGWLVTVALPGQAPRYELAGKAHHHHFHCNGCGLIFELKSCFESFRNMTPRGFRITAHEVLLYGICRSCREAQTAKP